MLGCSTTSYGVSVRECRGEWRFVSGSVRPPRRSRLHSGRRGNPPARSASRLPSRTIDLTSQRIGIKTASTAAAAQGINAAPMPSRATRKTATYPGTARRKAMADPVVRIATASRAIVGEHTGAMGKAIVARVERESAAGGNMTALPERTALVGLADSHRSLSCSPLLAAGPRMARAVAECCQSCTETTA